MWTAGPASMTESHPRYPSDLTDAEWQLAPLLPPPAETGRPVVLAAMRRADERDLLCAARRLSVAHVPERFRPHPSDLSLVHPVP